MRNRACGMRQSAAALPPCRPSRDPALPPPPPRKPVDGRRGRRTVADAAACRPDRCAFVDGPPSPARPPARAGERGGRCCLHRLPVPRARGHGGGGRGGRTPSGRSPWRRGRHDCERGAKGRIDGSPAPAVTRALAYEHMPRAAGIVTGPAPTLSHRNPGAQRGAGPMESPPHIAGRSIRQRRDP